MPISLFDTAGANNANTYVSLTDANTYFAERPFSTAWTSQLDDDVKARALIAATRRVDQMIFEGYKTTDTQRLQWPRDVVEDPDREGWVLDNATIPRRVKNAVCEIALTYLAATSDPSAVNALSQFAELRLPGGLAITPREGASTNDALPPVVWRELGPLMGSGSTYLSRG